MPTSGREFDYVAVWSVENVTSDEVIAFDPRVDDPFGKLHEALTLDRGGAKISALAPLRPSTHRQHEPSGCGDA